MLDIKHLNCSPMIWKRLFNKNSSAEKGTLYQLKNLLHHTAVALVPGDNMKAAEDFLEIVLHGHIVAAAESIYATSDGSLSDLSQALLISLCRLFFLHPNQPQQGNHKTEYFSTLQK